MNNTELIEKYIKAGFKKNGNDKAGMELEHFVISDDGNNVSYFGETGVGNLLKKISEGFENKIYSEGFLIGLSNNEYSMTLEPSAQLEISIIPTQTVEETEIIYEKFIKILNPVLDKYKYKLVTKGYRPKGTITQLDIIPKKRYKFMNEYFKLTGKYGSNMMRSTASTQVSIDYADEDDCIKKFRVANILSPLFSLISDNSNCFEGEIYKKRMLRTTIWENVDNDRCGIVPQVTDKNFSIKKYAEYVYSRPPILIMNKGITEFTRNLKSEDIYKNRNLSEDEIEHMLSMFFPNVRLKQYIEIRTADSMPIEYALSYMALIKGVFRHAEVFDYDVTDKDIVLAEKKLIEDGFSAEIYGKNAYEICQQMIEVARKNLNEREVSYLKPMEDIICNRTTLKEM